MYGVQVHKGLYASYVHLHTDVCMCSFFRSVRICMYVLYNYTLSLFDFDGYTFAPYVYVCNWTR